MSKYLSKCRVIYYVFIRMYCFLYDKTVRLHEYHLGVRNSLEQFLTLIYILIESLEPQTSANLVRPINLIIYRQIPW